MRPCAYVALRCGYKQVQLYSKHVGERAARCTNLRFFRVRHEICVELGFVLGLSLEHDQSILYFLSRRALKIELNMCDGVEGFRSWSPGFVHEITRTS